MSLRACAIGGFVLWLLQVVELTSLTSGAGG